MPDNDTSAPTRPTLTQRRVGGAHPSPTHDAEPHEIHAHEKHEMLEHQTVEDIDDDVIERSAAQRNVMDRANLERPMVGRPGINTINRSAAPILGRPMAANVGGQPPVNRQFNAPVDNEKSSPIKVVVWVIIAIALAVASYFALRNAFQPVTDNTNKTTAVEPTVLPTPEIINDEIVPDTEASNMQAPAAYNLNKQTVGTASDSTFSIDTLVGTKYQSFTRFAFGVTRLTGAESVVAPLVTAIYDASAKTITLKFAKTSTTQAEGLLQQDEQVAVNTASIDLLAHTSASSDVDDVYTLVLKAEAKYVLQLVTSGDRPQVIIDVKEPAVATTPVVTSTPSVTVTGTPKVTITVTPSPSPTAAAGGDILENAYSTAAQELHNGLTSNTADMVGSFAYIETAGEFTYDKQLSFGSNGKYPNVSAKLEDGKLIVTTSNLVNKNVAPQTLNFAPSKLVTSLLATRSGNGLTYEFTIGTGKQYRILFGKNTADKDVLRIQVK